MSQHVARKKHFMNFVVILANFLNGAGYFQMAQIVFQMAQNLRHLRPYVWLRRGKWLVKKYTLTKIDIKSYILRLIYRVLSVVSGF